MPKKSLRCPTCGLRHTAADRVPDRGKRICPKCGEPTAMARDINAEGPPYA